MPGEIATPILDFMAAHTLRLNKAKLNAVGLNEARKSVRKVVRGTFNRSQVLVPVDNGVLRASGKQDPPTVRGLLVTGGVEYTARYAAAVHNSRRALTIRAKPRAGGRPGYLKFTVGGRTVYARQVHQKARAGRPYLSTALAEVAIPAGYRVSRGGFTASR